LNPIYHLDPSVSNVPTIYLPCIPLPVVFIRALFLVLCFSSCTPLPSALTLTHTHLQNALQQISSWMTVNLLTLNCSKTEFLLIGLSKQLAKIHNSSLSTPTLLAILASYLMNTFLFPTRSQLSLSILLLSHLSTSLHPSLPLLENSLYHCHLHCPL